MIAHPVMFFADAMQYTKQPNQVKLRCERLVPRPEQKLSSTRLGYKAEVRLKSEQEVFMRAECCLKCGQLFSRSPFCLEVRLYAEDEIWVAVSLR